MGGSIPDHSVKRGKITIFACKVKTIRNINVDNLVQQYNDLQDERNSTSPIVRAVQQIFGALAGGQLRFGALTTYQHSWFLCRPPEDPGCSMVSSRVDYSSTNSSIIQCLVFVLNLALGDHHSPLPPEINYDYVEDGVCIEDDYSDSDSSNRTYKPPSNLSSHPVGCRTTRSSLRLQQFNWNSYRLMDMLGSGRNGTVFEGYFRGEIVAIKICDILRKPAYEKEMLAEVEVYSSLLMLQGKVIPELKGVGYSPSELLVFIETIHLPPIPGLTISHAIQSPPCTPLRTGIMSLVISCTHYHIPPTCVDG